MPPPSGPLQALPRDGIEKWVVVVAVVVVGSMGEAL
jgi:hypothetical protein